MYILFWTKPPERSSPRITPGGEYCVLSCSPLFSLSFTRQGRRAEDAAVPQRSRSAALTFLGGNPGQRDAETVIHAFISSRLDYCNALFSGLPNSTTKSLQLVQNATARLLTRTRKFDNIIPILSFLYWLPIKARSDFKVLLLTYKILHGLSPTYLKDLIIPYCPSRPLLSLGAGLPSIPIVQKKPAVNRAFSYRAPICGPVCNLSSGKLREKAGGELGHIHDLDSKLVSRKLRCSQKNSRYRRMAVIN
ncbi:hypothetical protein N1851_032741 [Merluccius polli]|uniref:Uncharacterized protein n=1 Tax=Merluccius polli TaxID=89951 RepID=A0AA47M2D9_MERPO|nr:hypothetical protein N1851_032741 [Merluccius polli]